MSTRRLFPRHADDKLVGWPLPGTYRKTKTEEGPSAVITCPDCKKPGSLSGSHEIRDNGYVEPSVVCPCGFHEFIILADWEI